MLNDTFRTLSEEVIINGERQDAIVTTANLGESEKRHISSLQPFKEGDIVEHRGNNYMVMEEVVTKRHNKYRATMSHCDYSFTVRDLLEKRFNGLDDLGRPKYQYVYSERYEVLCVVDKLESTSHLNVQFATMDKKIIVSVQDTEKNRINFEVNSEQNFKGNKAKVIIHDLTHNGRINLVFLLGGVYV